MSNILQYLLLPIKKFMRYLVRHFLYKYQHNAYSITFYDKILEWQPDVIHCNDWQTLSLGVLIKNNCNAHVIFDSHELETHRNPPLSKRRKRWMEAYERKLFPSCDLITTVCEPISAHLANEYNITKPAIIYNAPVEAKGNYGLERWGRISTNTDLRSETNCAKNVFLMVMVGNVTVNRGFETTLKALQSLPEDIHLAILGSISRDFRKILFDLMAKYNLQDRVHILPPVNPKCVVDYIKSADVGLISLIPATLSYDFALPNKLFECVFAGLPIIASDTQEIGKKVIQYQLGSLYEAGNVESLKLSVLAMYENKQIHKNSVQSKKSFIQDHDFERNSQCILDFIKNDI